MKVKSTGIKFIHWECNKHNNGVIIKSEYGIKPNYALKPKTSIKIGFSLRYIVHISTKKGQLVNCVAEEVFFIDDIPNFTFDDAKELLKTVLFVFEVNFKERSRYL